MTILRKMLIPASALILFASIVGCSSEAKSPDVSGNIRNSLDQSGLKNVSVSQDRDKGVVTLTGNVAGDSDRAQAENIAKSIAGSEVIADEIQVVPPGDGGVTKKVDSDLDAGIGKNLDAVLTQNRMNKAVSYSVKNGVVTLTGDVHSDGARARAERLATSVPNVQQVVNELQVKDQKATSSL